MTWHSREPALCECGRGLPRLHGIQGRSADVITAPGGKLLHGEFFTHLFYKIPGVRQFRVEQTELRRLMIEVVPGQGFSLDSLDSLVDAIHEQGDQDFVVECVVRDSLPSSNSGKFRFTTSTIGPDLSKAGRR